MPFIFQAHIHHYTQVDEFEECGFTESIDSLVDLREEYCSLEKKEVQVCDGAGHLQRLKISGWLELTPDRNQWLYHRKNFLIKLSGVFWWPTFSLSNWFYIPNYFFKLSFFIFDVCWVKYSNLRQRIENVRCMEVPLFWMFLEKVSLVLFSENGAFSSLRFVYCSFCVDISEQNVECV